MKITDEIFKSIFNESVWIPITISLKFVPKGPINYNSALVQVVAWHRTGEKPLPESMLTQFTALVNKITKIFFHCGSVHLASLRWNSPKIFHTVFETLPVGAKSLPILTPDYWHPPQSNFTEYKQDMVAVFYAQQWWKFRYTSWLTPTHINSRHSGTVQWKWRTFVCITKTLAQKVWCTIASNFS